MRAARWPRGPAPLLTLRPSSHAPPLSAPPCAPPGAALAPGGRAGRPCSAFAAAPPRRAPGRGPAEPVHSVQETSRVFLTSPYFCG